MKINPAVALTFLLLAFMLGSGVISATWGFVIGREALKGITQPDSRPTNKVNRKGSEGREELVFVKEEDVLKTVTERMGDPGKSTTPSPASSPQSKSQNNPTNSPTAAKLPISAQDQGVTFQVTGVRRKGDALMLDVAMKNEGTQPVKFLYSFLNVTDDKGRVLTTDTTGLPAELAAKSDRFTGTVSIATAMLEDAQKLSLQLTDYPDQKLQLKMTDIPVKER
jgi:hypothetical protein